VIEPTLLARIQRHAREWGVAVEDTLESENSVISFGRRESREVVLKVIKRPGDEWLSGEVLRAFDGHGVVRVHEHAPGAVLMDRLRPGNSLVEMTTDGRDEEATDILADVMKQMSGQASSISPLDLPRSAPTVHDWAKGFDRYLATRDEQLPKSVVEAGAETYLDLCASQRWPLLLHGDLQHYNVLLDADRGWLAIDPKGIIGELEYEIGAMLRNPRERPSCFCHGRRSNGGLGSLRTG
jgi:streptomycin 6-kinase